MQNGEVLESPALPEPLFYDDGCPPDGFDPVRGDFPDDAGCQCRTRKGDPGKEFQRKTHRFSHFSDPLLAQLDERLQYPVSEGGLRIYSQLLENIVLPLDAGHGLIDIGENGALQ